DTSPFDRDAPPTCGVQGGAGWAACPGRNQPQAGHRRAAGWRTARPAPGGNGGQRGPRHRRRDGHRAGPRRGGDHEDRTGSGRDREVATMSDRITLGGMQFVGRHGVTDEERAEAQPFEVDLLVRLDLSTPARTDDLADTVDYGALFKLTREVVEGPSFHLLEALAAAIADAV